MANSGLTLLLLFVSSYPALSQTSDGPAEPQETSRLFELKTNRGPDSKYFRDDFYAGNVLGFFYDASDKIYRIYFQDRSKKVGDQCEVEAMESTDLEHWINNRVVPVRGDAHFLVGPTGIECWIADGSDAWIWRDFDKDAGCRTRSHKVISDWKIDGTLGPNYMNGKYMQLGRVRSFSRTKDRDSSFNRHLCLPGPES